MERLSGMDALFLYAESPSQHMHVTLCAVLDPTEVDGGCTFERLRAHIQERVPRIPAFTRRLVPLPLGLHHPLWVDDPAPDLAYHVRRAALPRPGDDDALARFTAQIAGMPLDRARPLWEIWLLEGLEHGRIALLAKVHHAALDGVAGVESLVTLFDLEREPPSNDASDGADRRAGDERAERAGRAGGDDPTDVAPRAAEEIPSDLELLTYGAVSKLRGALGFVPLARRTAGSVLAVRNRRARPDAASGATPLVAPATPFNGTITGSRRVAFARVSLDEIKQVKQVVPGATVNDVILAVCAGALRTYLLERDELPTDPLVAACPINVRTDDQQGRSDNRVSAMFVRLHTELADPLERLAATHDTAVAAKDEHALFGGDTLQQWAELIDPNVSSWLSNLYAGSGLAARHRPAINVMISNVPGPPFPLYLAGAELERAYPMGQIIEGVGLNITMMSYRSWVDFGFMAAATLVPDIARLADAVEPALQELVKAAAERPDVERS